MPIDKAQVSKSSRTTRDDSELKYLASKNRSLYYELWMMLEAESLWKLAEAVKDQQPARYNSAVEAFLLHFRNLRDFLYPSRESWSNKRFFDDVIANDFCSDWLAIDDDWEECSHAERERINKMLAHLSYSRPDLHRLAPSGWPIPSMSIAIQRAFARFLERMKPERKNWFEDIKIG